MYQYQHTITYQQSTTFGFGCRCTDKGQLVDVSDYAITAKIKDFNGRLITNVVVTNPSTGILNFSLPADITLPVKTLFMDVRVSKDGVERVSKQCVRILVQRVVTDG